MTVSIVEFNQDNALKCLCTKCPREKKSTCVTEKVKKLPDLMKNNMLKPADLPGLYCNSGKATCTDLDVKQPCICGNCPNFKAGKLAEGSHVGEYCAKGRPK